VIDDEVTVLMCLPVEGDPDRYIVPGSVQYDCIDCGIKVWVAPSGQQLIRERAATVVCMNCAQVRVDQKSGSLEITRGQAEEIKAWRRRD